MSFLDALLAKFGLHCESSKDVATLTERLLTFYSATDSYSDFERHTSKDRFWNTIVDRIDSISEKQCTILEFGAGRSDFASRLVNNRHNIELHFQDVTPKNQEHLEKHGDRVHISPLTSLSDEYDIIFSTFVWEHVPNPQETLEHLLGLLREGGSLFIAAPRYDIPGYLSPSASNRKGIHRFTLALSIFCARIRTLVSRKPLFAIDTKPALFEHEWFRDADAIHWVSKYDFLTSVPKNFSLLFHIPSSTGYFRDVFWSKFLVLFVEYRKD